MAKPTKNAKKRAFHNKYGIPRGSRRTSLPVVTSTPSLSNGSQWNTPSAVQTNTSESESGDNQNSADVAGSSSTTSGNSAVADQESQTEQLDFSSEQVEELGESGPSMITSLAGTFRSKAGVQLLTSSADYDPQEIEQDVSIADQRASSTPLAAVQTKATERSFVSKQPESSAMTGSCNKGELTPSKLDDPASREV